MSPVDEIAAVAGLLDKIAAAHKLVMQIPNYEEALCTVFALNNQLMATDIFGMVMSGNDNEKNAMLSVVSARLAIADAYAYVFLCEGWFVKYPKGTREEDIYVRPRDDDRRQECLTLYYESKAGITQFRSYTISRNPVGLSLDPPGEKTELRWAGLLAGRTDELSH